MKYIKVDTEKISFQPILLELKQHSNEVSMHNILSFYSNLLLQSIFLSKLDDEMKSLFFTNNFFEFLKELTMDSREVLLTCQLLFTFSLYSKTIFIILVEISEVEFINFMIKVLDSDDNESINIVADIVHNLILNGNII